jgi:hypothetical protein
MGTKEIYVLTLASRTGPVAGAAVGVERLVRLFTEPRIKTQKEAHLSVHAIHFKSLIPLFF